MSVGIHQDCSSLEIDGVLLQAEKIRTSLLKWFECNGRHWIPWKLKPDGSQAASGEILPVYEIWIAEVMLQQTQLKIVLPYWKQWMEDFPSLIVLANTEESKVLLHWQGLGYYSRAKRLHQSSKLLLDLIGLDKSLDEALWPKTLKKWMQLPGIGRSTAGSIISSAFDLPVSLLDGNLKRVFSRLIAIKANNHKDELKLWAISDALLDKRFPRKFNQALMDLGATVCTPRNPCCHCCPIQKHCIAYNLFNPKDFPAKNVRKSIPFYVIGIGVVFNAEGKVLIDQRLNHQNMGGMWEFPGGKQEKDEIIQLTIIRELKEELSIDVEVISPKLIEFDHAYSHKKFRFIVHICKLVSGVPQPLASQQLRWVMPNELDFYPFPAANTRIISALRDYLTYGE